MKKTAQDVSINESLDVDKDGNALTLMDIISDESNIVDKIDTKIKIEKLGEYIKKYLTPRERTIIELRYGLGGKPQLTQRQVAQKLNISRSYVSRIEKSTLQKLKKAF